MNEVMVDPFFAAAKNEIEVSQPSQKVGNLLK
jgi:hypothetical protein